MVKGKDGCAYGMVTRERVDEIQKTISGVDTKIDKVNEKIVELFNHQSSRLPLWATVIITGLSSLTVGLIVWVVTHGPT